MDKIKITIESDKAKHSAVIMSESELEEMKKYRKYGTFVDNVQMRSNEAATMFIEKFVNSLLG